MATIDGSSNNDLLKGTALADLVSGEAGDDTLYGYEGDDTLDGGSGNDLINGGAGADVLGGGEGNDTYVVNNVDCLVTEQAGQGSDTVRSSISYTLSAYVEKLVLTGTAAIDGTGTAANNVLIGNGSANALGGEAGRDTLSGGAGADSLDGGGGADRLLGGLGDDRLAGGAGADYLDGGDGLDIAVYISAVAGVSVDLGRHQGLAGDALGDGLWAIEGIVGSPHADALTGDDGDNRLYGAYGADTIHGLAGDDFIHADAGPVFLGTYTLARDLSFFYGGDGNDTIWGDTQVASTADPSYFQPVEIYGGEGDDDLYNGLVVDGGPGNDYVYGGAIDSTIDGGDGADVIQATYGNHTVDGGAGDDFVWTEALHGGTNVVALGAGDDLGAVYSYDPANAHRFDGGEGIDELIFASNDLSDTTRVALDALDQLGGGVQQIGVVQLTNFERFTLLLGGEHDDVLELGNLEDRVSAADGNDYVLGRQGDDFLDGGYGVDTVLGGPGNDVVIAGPSPAGMPENVRGGGGDDVVYGNFSSADWAGVARLYGNAGHDVFAFLPAPIYTADRVMDFVAGEDRIAVYAGAYWYVDPAARSFEAISTSKVTDTADQLRFGFVGRFGDEVGHQIEVRYDKNTGALALRDASAAISEWKLVCTVAGGPDLHVGDFLTLSEAQAASEAAVGVYGAPSADWLGGKPAVGSLYYDYATWDTSAADSAAGMGVAHDSGALGDLPMS